MACPAITPRISWLAAVVAAAIMLLLAAGPAAQPASAASACARYGDTHAGDLRLGDARDAIRCYLNRERSQRGLPKLDRDRRLQRASQKHSEVMDNKECFAHQCPGEGSLETRLRSVEYLLSGLLRWAYGENIAWGTGRLSTPKSMVKAWMNSPGHRANILNPLFRDLGVGFVRGSPDRTNLEGGIYTTDFGLRLL